MIGPRLLCAAAVLAVAVPAVAPAAAQSYKAGGLIVSRAWTRPAAAGMNGAGYLTITNGGKSADTFLGAETTAAKSITFHQSVMNGDIASMKALPTGVAIAPGQSLRLEPGGYHLMIIGLTKAQAPGGKLPVVLKFAKAGRIAVNLSVDEGSQAVSRADMPHKH